VEPRKDLRGIYEQKYGRYKSAIEALRGAL
jgi:hypothetical protein